MNKHSASLGLRVKELCLKLYQHMFLKEMVYTLVEEAQVELNLLVVNPDQQSYVV